MAKRKPARRHVSPGLNSFVPADLPDSTEQTIKRLATMPVALLPTLGLAETYLGMTPIRATNQCVLACWVITVSLVSGFGIHAETVSAQLDISTTSGGGIARYGSTEPRFTSEGVIGHVALIADETFVDPTGGQFPELAAICGVRAIGGDLRGSAGTVLSRGAIVPLSLDAPGLLHVQYTLGKRGSADAAMTAFIEQPDAEHDVARLANNLTLVFAKTISLMPDKMAALSRMSPYRRLVTKAEQLRYRTLEYDDRGVCHARER